MKFYTSDWTDDPPVMKMSLAERGLYFDMLCYSWRHGAIPDDSAEVALAIRRPIDEVSAAWPAVAAMFQRGSDTMLRNARQEDERADMAARHQERKASGKKGAKGKWGSHAGQNGSAISNAGGSAIRGVDGEQKQSRAKTESEKEQQQEGDEAAAEFEKIKGDLVSDGVDGPTAERLAREDPLECRRQLEFLPKRSKIENRAAYLVAAIKGKYDLPVRPNGSRREVKYRSWDPPSVRDARLEDLA
ncbi:MAG TPA: DUF1376 domain-containing protein [Candidatus Tumulicola sp.]|nr:DUF1376 domain-containing protein [Candidatus Tumulicola sp.]